jgi:hypothetical protein
VELTVLIFAPTPDISRKFCLFRKLDPSKTVLASLSSLYQQPAENTTLYLLKDYRDAPLWDERAYSDFVARGGHVEIIE